MIVPMMLLIRYLPANGLIKGGSSCCLASLWIWLFPPALDAILVPVYGEGSNSLRWPLQLDLFDWSTGVAVETNVYCLTVFVLAIAGAGLLIGGLLRLRRAKR